MLRSLRFSKAKAVHSVLRHLADQRKMNLEDLYVQIGWPLYKKYGHAYDAFKLTLAPGENTEDPFADVEMEPVSLYGNISKSWGE